MRDNRRAVREVTKTAIQFEWSTADGRLHHVLGQCKNVSASGIGSTIPVAVAVGESVSIRLPEINLVGTGKVRHCSPFGRDYTLGVQLDGELREING